MDRNTGCRISPVGRIWMKTFSACAAATVIAIGCGLVAQSGAARRTAASSEWPTYGHDPGGLRFSPLTQITLANVSQLKVAWAHPTQPHAGAGRLPSTQGHPPRGHASSFPWTPH